MDFTKIIVLLTLLNFVCSADPDKGYLLLNGSIPNKGCYNLPGNTQCPSNLINYKVFGLGYADNFSTLNLKSVDLMIMSLKFFKEVTPACEDAVREYACSNTFARCEKDDSQTLGAVVTFNVTHTSQACAKVKKSCPLPVQAATINNCTTIMGNFTDLIYCVDIPNIPGDICSKSNYKHPKAIADFYPTVMSHFKDTFTRFASIFGSSDPQCKKKFLDVNCELLRGPICSTNMMLRMYTTTQQQCEKTVNKCVPSVIPNLQPYLLEMCKLFPDGNIAKMVPLPRPDTSNDSL